MLAIKNISKTLGYFKLQNIDFCIQEGEYIAVLGPTGTGKTVLLEILTGMYSPDEGEIIFNGKNITNMEPEDREIGFVYQDYLLFPHLSVKENIIFGLKIRRMPKKVINEKLEAIASLLGIQHLLSRYHNTLSGGEQQRVAIARTLITQPKLLLLDEPLSALDPRTKENFQHELKKIHENSKTTTIHITHDFTEAIMLADRIVVMNQGCIEQIGTAVEIFKKPKSLFVASFIGFDNIYEGNIFDSEDRQKVQIDNIELYVASKYKGTVKVSIPADKITISKEKLTVSTHNCIKCKVVDIIPQGTHFKVKLDGGILLTSIITKTMVENIKILYGQMIYAAFEVSAVHVWN